jgi:uncharacterized protein (DUF1800 family)
MNTGAGVFTSGVLASMLERLTSAIAANPFGLGSRPGELGTLGTEGRDWLRAQLQGSKRDAQLRGVGFDCESSSLSDGGLVAPLDPCEVGSGGDCGADS